MNAKSRREIMEKQQQAWNANASMCEADEKPCENCGVPVCSDEKFCYDCDDEIQKNEKELEHYELLEKALWQAECERGEL